MKNKNLIKNIEVIFLSFLLLVTSFFSNGGKFIAEKEIKAANEKVNLSKVLSSNKINELDRPASEGLWKITAGGKESFCLNSGKSMCSGDTVKDKTYYGATYSHKAIAKALTYYYKTLGGNAGTKKFALVQAYIWACGKGASKQTTVYQAGRNIDKGWSNADAKKFCDKIADTDPEGTIHYYTVTKCVRGKKLNAHQVLYGWSKKNPAVEKKKLSLSDHTTAKENVKLSVKKKDAKTGSGLAGATYQVKCDGKSITSATTDANGNATYTYQRNYTSKTYSSTKNYVKNWNELAESQKKDLTKNGYYASKAKAQAAAKAEIKNKADADIAQQKKGKHTWEVSENNAPFGHFLASDAAKSAVEQPGKKSFAFTFINAGKTMDLELSKKSAESDSGVEATTIGAKYGLYARDIVYRSDLKTVAYQKDQLVGTLITGTNSKAKLTGLYPGYYYLKELSPPKGFQKDNARIEVDLSTSNQTVTLKDHVIQGKIKLKKTFGGEKNPEASAEFEVYNAKDQKVDTLVTDEDGTVESKLLPYGNYRIHQTKGTKGYSFVQDMILSIDGREEDGVYDVEADDEEEYACIALTKTKTIDDTETRRYEKSPESNAEFDILDSDGENIETLVLNQYGTAKSRELEPGTYTVHQSKASQNFAKVKDFTIEIKEKEKYVHEYKLDNPYNGNKIRIHKTKTKNGKTSAEEGAVFTILDAAYCKKIGTTDLETTEQRDTYTKTLDEKAFLGQISTDSDGNAALLLDDFTGDAGFIVLQTDGTKAYALADPYYSYKHQPKVEDGISVYTFDADDPFDDYATLKIKKTMQISEAETAPEEGAQFQIKDVQGTIVDTITIGENGEAKSIPLSFGLYTIHQSKGENTHLWMDDSEVVLTKENKHKVVTFEANDQEKQIQFTLTKKSAETGILLDGAIYGLYNEEDELVTKLVTGADGDKGKAVTDLSYGSYYIKEITAPDGYNRSDVKESFILDLKSVDYDKDGNGSYHCTDTDAPIMGDISVHKKGEALTGYSDMGFTYEDTKIKGAVYGLYAKEDIKKDDGTVVWKAGTKIDEKTTNEEGTISFTRTGVDEKETKNFYLGTYYVKEISAPYGYTVDQAEHEVTLTWDIKPGDMNGTDNKDNIKDQEDPIGNNTPYPNSGIYVLEQGEKFNEKVKDAESITFTWQDAPKGVATTDVSANEDGSVILWKEDGDYYVSSQKAGQVIYLNADSSRIFAGCANLVEIKFKNNDTASVVDMSEMFAGDEKLTKLDLSSFNTNNVENMSKMFYGCTGLETVETLDQELQKQEEEYEDAKPIYIEAIPKNEFALGDELKANDFTWRYTYDDDGETEVEVTNADVEFNPEIANKAGKMKVQVSFKSTSIYAKYQTIESEIMVIDPDAEDVALHTTKQASIQLNYTDQLQKYAIHVIKKDQDGKLLEGATFALKAACEIVNHKGDTVFKEGDTISTAVSPDDQFGYLEFFGLPSDLNAKNGKGTEMFLVEETIPPDGYKKSDEVLSFKGEVVNQNAAAFIHDVTSEGNTNDSETTYIHDSKEVINQKIPYVSIKKNWDDNNNEAGKRPVAITVTATNKDTKETLTYTLNKENNWTAVTKIAKEDKGQYTFSESCAATGYEQVGEPGGTWDDKTYVIGFTNQYKDQKNIVNIDVEKKWEDNQNQDGIRPTSVTVNIYKNGSIFDSAVLKAGNNWSYKWAGLDAVDSAGEEIEYEVREVTKETITGDAKTGYAVEYESQETKTETEKNIIWKITNTHQPNTTKKSIKKIWKDGENKDGIRPDSTKVNLLADGIVQDTYILNEGNSWKAETGVLPVYQNGSKVNYTWKEVKEGWISGESFIGYEPSYSIDADDDNKTILTNTHNPDAPKGKIVLYKEVDPSNMVDLGDLTFTLKLSGIDVYGKEYSETQDVIFKAADLKKQAAEHPGEKMKLSATFSNLNYGTYTATEYGMEKYFKLGGVTSTSKNVQISKTQDSFKVQVKIGPDSEKQALNGDVTFFNELQKGSLKIKKIDESGNIITGAKFTLKDGDGNELSQKESGEDGTLVFSKLTPGTYTVTENKTKGGYKLLKKPFTVTVPLAMSSEEVERQKADTSDAVKVGDTYYFYDMTYEVGNGAMLDLPTTGASGQPYLLLVAGFLLVLAGGIAWKKKRNM